MAIGSYGQQKVRLRGGAQPAQVVFFLSAHREVRPPKHLEDEVPAEPLGGPKAKRLRDSSLRSA
ncbi:MAG: hypothetical protein RMM06_11950 [Armatimonadota bacterium]|nr:hypothetical protein [Armatimonadota bacterium]